METLQFKKSNAPGKFSTYLAAISFGLGTLLLVAYMACPSQYINIMTMGFFYVLMAILLNGVTLFHLAYLFAIHPIYREILAIRILLLLSNIPVVFLYLNIVFNNKLS